MSCCSPHQTHGLVSDGTHGGSICGYDSDFTPEEEELLNELLDKFVAEKTEKDTAATVALTGAGCGVPATAGLGGVRLQSLPAVIPDIEDHVHVSALRFGEGPGREPLSSTVEGILEIWESVSDFEIEDVVGDGCAEHPDSIEGREKDRRRDAEESQLQAAAVSTNGDTKSDATKSIDKRSPLERFRKAPRKNLSVTDLVSPAWCELQYWYSLTRHGRKRPTPAMKQGSAVHRTLEEQVHTTIPVEVLTREDGWALRIWNVIQGLHTLRTTGMTRELEVWGVIDGEMVTGIIDELSYECPDFELELASDPKFTEVRSAASLIPEDGISIADYLLSPAGGCKPLSDWAGSTTSASSTTERQIYITDIKTRRSSTTPTVSSVAFRPTLLQLHLYYHMLTRLITSDDITIDSIASRYRLNTSQPFSDSFVAQVGSLDSQFLDINSSPEAEQDFEGESIPSNEQDSIAILLSHNSLSSLWSLMKQHLQLTFLPTSPNSESSTTPDPLSTGPNDDTTNTKKDSNLSPPTLLSPLLTATYVSSPSDSSNPMKYIGSRSFFFDSHDLYPYLADGMRFWRGDRAAKGVGMVEAWKCRICEFRDDCEWRGAKEEEIARRGVTKEKEERDERRKDNAESSG
ncbi:hypothetical protein PRK78_000354 [Emydomyces testavorans]|uniref:Exonuclease V n=1 Tax=Emydomyces testavorans TaxID=2070801 RepID=A0AAF0IFI4_9EURO|nr:hypothetical protein PRK78_000354 [Emydomyces testavorans]